ncbi:dTDP-4-dehydrorhamnose reductase [Sphingobacterium sp. SYP-B4668]|uniref:dTDP-4-dehydrorhamnose reductase n=1 Tax=Sphingobacterium sp. SYP-B4668 TaxID=2996035 RepID=UPI0022DE151F|nr:dTDP-4-dehydrorhamnose reductase [Sphingobacterium sp. SYP-B4668]
MRKILVTGSKGQLGSELRTLYQDRKDVDTFFLDRGELPLEQTSIIQDILGIYQPDLIIHAAAYTAVDKAEGEAELANVVNHLASEEIAQYCHVHGTKLIAISTDYVFDGTSSMPLDEDAVVEPINIYGSTKLKGEVAVQKWLPDAIIIRTSWVYSIYGSNFVKTMIRLMTERDEISVIEDQVGSPTYAKDLAQAIVDIIDRNHWVGGMYHYSNEGEISWYNFATAIKEIQGLNCTINPIPTSQYPTPAKRPKYSLLDKSKIKRTFNIKVPDWRDSLAVMLSKLL